MASLTVRNLDADVLETEVRVLLRDIVDRGPETSLRDLADRIAALTPNVVQTDSTALVRKDRTR